MKKLIEAITNRGSEDPDGNVKSKDTRVKKPSREAAGTTREYEKM